MIFAVVLVALGVAGCVWFLTGQGLDRAEKWVSLVGVFLAVALGVAGTFLGWASWRGSRVRAGTATTASGERSVAIAELNSGKIETQSPDSLDRGRAGGAPPGGVTASGSGAVAIGGANTGDITTRSDGPRRKKR